MYVCMYVCMSVFAGPLHPIPHPTVDASTRARASSNLYYTIVYDDMIY